MEQLTKIHKPELLQFDERIGMYAPVRFRSKTTIPLPSISTVFGVGAAAATLTALCIAPVGTLVAGGLYWWASLISDDKKPKQSIQRVGALPKIPEGGSGRSTTVQKIETIEFTHFKKTTVYHEGRI
jgi:hypothetical protein